MPSVPFGNPHARRAVGGEARAGATSASFAL